MITAVAYIAIPLGMLLAGLAVERFSVSVTLFIIAACYLLVTTAQAFNSALREMDGKEGRPVAEIETSQEQG
jgi:1,4-dihydroxy-2-naphthoate octaprenyltransferase